MNAISAPVISPATNGDARTLAKLHALAFPQEPWGPAALESLLQSPGVLGLIATGASGPRGFILARGAADEAEILTLAVHPKARRQGIARRLAQTAAARLAVAGAKHLHLEVAADNQAALALYETLGFARTGLRRAYYQRGASRIDAVTMAVSCAAAPSSGGQET
jgi:ribosomal-protein-alanine N-acetyltransferase